MKDFRVEIFYNDDWHIFEEYASSHLQAKNFAITNALHEIYGKSWKDIWGKSLDIKSIKVYGIKDNKLFYSLGKINER